LSCSDSPHGEVLAFRDKAKAVIYALIEFIFNNLAVLDLSCPQIRSLLFLDDASDYKSLETQQRRVNNRLKVDNAIESRVFYLPGGFRFSQNKHPFLIALQYPGGGSAYYLCDDLGRRTSYPLLKRSFPSCISTTRGDMYEFICIVGCRTGRSRSQDYANSMINLIIRWRDGTTTEEPMSLIFKDCPIEVVHFAEKKKLLKEAGWSRVRNASEKFKLINANREHGYAVAMAFPAEQRRNKKRGNTNMSGKPRTDEVHKGRSKKQKRKVSKREMK
jgi:hypothetical protein